MEDEIPNFDCQEIDPIDNKPDLQRWVDEDEMMALICEKSGGIIGYIHYDHIDRILEILNNKE